MKNNTVLVTGGSGFLGIHIIAQLLESGYIVKTTLRDLSKKEQLLEALSANGDYNLNDLSFFQADLTKDEGWDLAATDCAYVLHVASPFPMGEPEQEDELIVPAVEGTLRVLKAANRAQVKRVVITSSFAAVGYSINKEGYVFTEKDWTDDSTPLPAYIKSKTVAEKAAWRYIEKEGNGMELTVINPVGIFGPVFGGISSSSIQIAIQGIINGDIKESPNFTMGVVDVRDAASLHISAMVEPKASGERFIAATDGIMSFYDVAQLIRSERPKIAGNIADMKPTPAAYYKAMSNQKAKSLLGWQPRSKEEALLSSADSLYNPEKVKNEV